MRPLGQDPQVLHFIFESAQFQIPKRSGGFRTIHAPTTSIKIIQRKLNQVLKCVYQPKLSTHGFVDEKSIITNAQQHLGKKCIINLDIKDFFPSINFGRVRGLFMAMPYNCSQEVATILAQICCYENQLPQGAPTSPIVSNMICARMDSELQRLARKHNCNYTRYADDITFSSSRSRLLHKIVSSVSSSRDTFENELRSIIQNNGFLINESKFRVKTQNESQQVTGITVNEKLNVRRKYVRQIRAMLYDWEKNGLESAQTRFMNKFSETGKLKETEISFGHVVKGKIEFLANVKGEGDQIYVGFLKKLKRLAPELVSDKKLEKAFSAYQEWQREAGLKSVELLDLWTEGKTDIIHLRAALINLQSNGQFNNFDIKSRENIVYEGDDNLLKRCRILSDADRKHEQPVICIFDRDKPNIIKEVHDENTGFKDWGNGVYSFAIPVPSNREGNISIEHYYTDNEIKRTDSKDRRLYLFNEFHQRSGRHKENGELSIRKTDSDQLKIIESDVFNSKNENVALPKADFATNVLENMENFNNFDFIEFSKIFEQIVKILTFHNSKVQNGEL